MTSASVCVHVPGVTNRAADALSRNALPSFFTQVPGADPYPQPIPSRLISALLCKDGDWLSPTWRKQFDSTILRA